MAKSKYQKFAMETVSRSTLRGAPYNPRTIDDIAKKKLRANLKKVGLIQPIIVNKTTGNVVSGHQRLACLDQIEGRGDYDLDVAVVELSEQEERRQNVFLNNASAMGDWDRDLLATILREDDDIAAFGFEAADIEVILPDEADSILADDETAEALDAVRDQATTRDDLKAQRKDRAEKAARDNDDGFYVTVYFADREECDAFLKKIEKPLTNNAIDGGDLMLRLR